ncbi:MAG: hypothetical protein U0270_41535 [Labilithrix sp.]
MFSAVSRFRRPPVEFAVGVAFERRFRIYTINRRGLRFDTRFSPATAGSMDGVIVYLLLEGTMRWDDGLELVGPALLVMRERDFEGAEGMRTRGFRSWGEPFQTVELRIPAHECAVRLDGPARVVPLDGDDDPVLAAGRLYLHASHATKGQTRAAELAEVYLRGLQARGIIVQDLASTMTLDEGLRGLLWDALRPAIESFGGAKQEVVVSRVGWNGRRVQRELTRMAVALGVGWIGSWRDVALRYRVRFAALLLSNATLSVGEIAEAVGYSSVEALAHAFEACGLPPATEVRRLLAGE